MVRAFPSTQGGPSRLSLSFLLMTAQTMESWRRFGASTCKMGKSSTAQRRCFKDQEATRHTSMSLAALSQTKSARPMRRGVSGSWLLFIRRVGSRAWGRRLTEAWSWLFPSIFRTRIAKGRASSTSTIWRAARKVLEAVLVPPACANRSRRNTRWPLSCTPTSATVGSAPHSTSTQRQEAATRLLFPRRRGRETERPTGFRTSFLSLARRATAARP
mmetsp:Transcript_141020/g.351705  ORF Transcript_141020/g.351705 Transcript_141020/m.351705 type:complete len:216 (-) Transcript_141020:728-1375(-)